MNTWMRNYLIFCHVAVLGAFVAAARFSYHHPTFLTWQSIILLAIAGLPFILPLLAYYVKGFGKDGVMMNNVFDDSVDAPPGEKEGIVFKGVGISEPEKLPAPQTKMLGDYSKPARKVLRTLWKFQREQFKDDFSQRWAFGVHPLAMDHPQFQAGVSELRYDGLILKDGRGMVFLTDKGITFCRDNESGLAGGDVWDKFGPA
ncbi:MAG: hypothetical protein RLZZ350_1385 [Verrucomicrobiota bacterium]|jgi:hypothetical protein